MQPRFLFTCFDILQVEEIAFFWKFYWLWKKRRMYTALPVPSEKSTSHMCPITLFFFYMCHATFILSTCLRGNSEIFLLIPLIVKFLSSRKSELAWKYGRTTILASPIWMHNNIMWSDYRDKPNCKQVFLGPFPRVTYAVMLCSVL